jgi:asparagine synthase (glutamine-hydrolysing)
VLSRILSDSGGSEFMSAQFGICNFDGKPVDPHGLDQVRPLLAPYGPDGEGYICNGDVGIIYRAFHTTKESRREVQPYVTAFGAVFIWDGRLDNRNELIDLLAGKTSASSTDLEIVDAAYERWGTDSFAKLIGDWALSLWEPTNRTLILAKDFIGTRQLYYSTKKNQATWCTILDPLLLFADHAFDLNEEYVAGWLSFFPAPDLTPYVGIHAVPPSSFVVLKNGMQSTSKYWDFDPSKQFHYHMDSEYEEHFRNVFANSVRRRLRSDSPVLAELSGGMDSSSIVCVADVVTRTEGTDAPSLDTVSYYDDSEPNWNEKPYFGKIEQKRGRVGHHIDASPAERMEFTSGNKQFAPTPSHYCVSPRVMRYLADLMKMQGNRVVLSGVGGDEVAGGVPTPVPELADFLAKGRLKSLTRQLKVWALVRRKPWFHVLFEVVRAFLPSALISLPEHLRPASWLDEAFIQCHRAAFSGYRSRLRIFGSLPSFQENIATTDLLRRQLACEPLSAEHPFELRYPFLDRDLLEFLYAIPRSQIIRPRERRSLMRRSLNGIVPDEILNRKRKAFVTRSPMTRILKERSRLLEMEQHMLVSSLNLLHRQAFRFALDEICQGKETNIVAVMRIIALEYWLRNSIDQGAFKLACSSGRRVRSGRETAQIPVTTQAQVSGLQKDSAS